MDAKNNTKHFSSIFKLSLLLVFTIFMFFSVTVYAAPAEHEEVEIKKEPSAIEIVKPLDEKQLIRQYIFSISKEYDVDPYLIEAMVWRESNYNPNAVNYDGSCVGLMQLSTYWNSKRASELGLVNFFDIESNLILGIDLISSYLKDYSIEYSLMLYSMNHDEAYELYSKGRVTSYVTEVLAKADGLRKEGVYNGKIFKASS